MLQHKLQQVHVCLSHVLAGCWIVNNLSVLLVQQRFLLPLPLQELCTALKFVVLRFSRVHSFLPPRLVTEASQASNHSLMLQVLCCLMKTLVLCTAFTHLRLTVVIKLQNNDPDNIER